MDSQARHQVYSSTNLGALQRMLCSFFGLSFPKYAALLIDSDKNVFTDFDSKPFSSRDGAIAITVGINPAGLDAGEPAELRLLSLTQC